MTGITPHDPANAWKRRSHRLTRRRFAAVALLAASSLPAIPVTAQETPEADLDAAGDPAGGPESLRTLLSIVPRRLGDPGEITIPFYYADLAGQFASLGMDQRDTVTGMLGGSGDGRPSILATMPLALVSQGYQLAMVEEFVAFVGFQPLLVEQALVSGEPPDQLSLFRGGIDLDALPAAWEDGGYRRTQTDSGTGIWTIGEQAEIDLERYPVRGSSFNNAAVLDSGVVVFGNRLDTVAEAVALATDGGESLADQPAIAPGIDALPDTIVSAIGIAPGYFGFDLGLVVEEERREAIEAELAGGDEGEMMPAWTSMIAGITAGFMDRIPSSNPGGPPDLVPNRHGITPPADRAIVTRLVTGSAADAAQAAEVVRRRWEDWDSLVTGQPMTGLMEIIESRAIDSVAAVDFLPARAPSVWIDLVFQRDLLPFAFRIAPDDEATPPAQGAAWPLLGDSSGVTSHAS